MAIYGKLLRDKAYADAEQAKYDRALKCDRDMIEVRYSYYSGGYQAERGSKPCDCCNGSGKVIRYIGPA